MVSVASDRRHCGSGPNIRVKQSEENNSYASSTNRNKILEDKMKGMHLVVLDVTSLRLSVIKMCSQQLQTGFYNIRNKSVLETKRHMVILFES